MFCIIMKIVGRNTITKLWIFSIIGCLSMVLSLVLFQNGSNFNNRPLTKSPEVLKGQMELKTLIDTRKAQDFQVPHPKLWSQNSSGK